MLRLLLLLSGALLVALQPARAEGPSKIIFGLELGAPIAFTVCKRSVVGVSTPKAGACVDDREASSLANGRLTGSTLIRFSPSELPVFVKSFALRGKFVDGVLVGVDFRTLGLAFDSEVLAQITAKFGAPSYSLANKVKTRVGAEFDAPIHLWLLDGVSISYTAVSGSLDQGLVSIDTPAAKTVDALEQKARDAALQGIRPL